MLYREYAPSPALVPFIECHWFASSTGRTPFRPREVLIPDGTTEVMLNFGGPYRRFRDAADREGVAVARSHIVGIRRVGVFIEQDRDQDVFGIRFRPGGLFPFLRIPMVELAHRSVDLEDLVGRTLVDELESRVADAGSAADRVAAVEHALMLMLTEAEYAPAVRVAVGAIFASGGKASIGRIADRIGLDQRAMNRAFDRHVGLSPKRLARIVRFNHALDAMQRGSRNLAAAAQEAGYFDQSHMIRDFREFTGSSPVDFLSERYAIVEAIRDSLSERLSDSYNP